MTRILSPQALAAKHISRGTACIARQRAIVARLARQGHSTVLAEQLLETMLKTLDHMVDDQTLIERLRGVRTTVAAAPVGDEADGDTALPLDRT